MKKQILFMTSVILSAILMSACQPAPGKDAVTGKSPDKMMETASTQTPEMASTQTPEGQPADGHGQSTLARKLGAPERLTMEFTDTTGKLKVSADAPVEVPDGRTIKVLRVEKSKFSQDAANKAMAALLHGKLYKCDENGICSKGDIMQQIIALKAILGNAPNEDGILRLEHLQEAYDAAPEKRETASTKLEHPTYTNLKGETETAMNEETIRGTAVTDRGYETFCVQNFKKGIVDSIHYVREPNKDVGFASGIGWYTTAVQAYDPKANLSPGRKAKALLSTDEIKAIPDITMTQKEAAAAADELVKKIGTENMRCYSIQKAYGGSSDPLTGELGAANPLRCVWRLRYTRTVEGMPTTYTSDGCNEYEENEQAAPWEYESMTIYIDERGVTAFEWVSPYHVTGTKTENANLQPFDKIQDVFKRMIGAKYASNQERDTEIRITRVQLGISRITEKNKRDAGLLIPVWDFFGTLTQRQDGAIIDAISDPEKSYLTINAMDGSVIDRDLGY